MSSTYNPGRVAGFLYLILVVIAPFRLIYVPSTLIVPGNATATANNIATHQLLFRLGIVADLFCGTILIFLVLALYRLLKGVDQNQAVLMVIVGGVIPATIDFLNVLNDAAALTLVAALTSYRSSGNLSGTPWPCCSSICIASKSLPPRSFGSYGFFP